MNEIEFECTIKSPNAKEILAKLFDTDTVTVYTELMGDIIPIADISRHSECPKEIFRSFIKYIAVNFIDSQEKEKE